MAFQHKYSVEIEENIPAECACPPAEADEILEPIEAFRFVFDPLNESSFIPTGISNAAVSQGKSAEICCAYHGLSMYKNPVKAKKAYEYYCSIQAEFPAHAGSHLATGWILPGDGLVTHPSRRSSHFTLHQDENCNLPPQFQIAEEL